nr:uncharacterized protein LOC129382584 [Dermacentor andersoni]
MQDTCVDVSTAFISDFLPWKDNVESKTCSHFVASTGRKENSSGVFRRYLNCHRSGTYIELPTTQRKHQIKVQGSSKIGIPCFAMLEVTERDSKVFVVFQKNHYGHLDEIAHQRLSVAETKVIAGRLAEGVPPKTILQKIKAGTSAASSRMKLVTREDLRNIRDKYNIDKAERRHPDDFMSVELWVKETEEEKKLNTGIELMCPENEPSKAGSDSPLLYYRKEGDPSSSEGNFELALIIFPQRELLCKLGIEKLCIDSTHGTNRYKFQLATLLTISEDGSGILCAYLISKRVNTETMVRFSRPSRKR